VYGWLWRRLPGNRAVRLLTASLLVLLAAGLLWYVVFPWLETYVAFDEGILSR
jgi:hypothetical protein